MPDHLKNRLQSLVDKGVIERHGRGRGVKYILSRRYYEMVGEEGVYTRRKGLDREANKTLLLKHIVQNRNKGSGLKEFVQVLPFLSKNQIQKLVAELKKEGKIYKTGVTKGALWYPLDTEIITP